MIIKQNSRVNLMVKCEKNSNIKTEGGCRSQQLIFNAQFDHNELQIGQNVNSKTNAHLWIRMYNVYTNMMIVKLPHMNESSRWIAASNSYTLDMWCWMHEFRIWIDFYLRVFTHKITRIATIVDCCSAALNRRHFFLNFFFACIFVQSCFGTAHIYI